MIQVKNNFTGASGVFTTLTKAFNFFNTAIDSIGIKKFTKDEFFKTFKKNKRFKVGFGNISIVVSEAKISKS